MPHCPYWTRSLYIIIQSDEAGTWHAPKRSKKCVSTAGSELWQLKIHLNHCQKSEDCYWLWMIFGGLCVMKPRYLWVNRAAFQVHWVSFLPEKLITLILKSSPVINGVSNFSHENMRIAVPRALIFVGGFNMIFLFGMKIPLAQTAFFLQRDWNNAPPNHQPFSAILSMILGWVNWCEWMLMDANGSGQWAPIESPGHGTFRRPPLLGEWCRSRFRDQRAGAGAVGSSYVTMVAAEVIGWWPIFFMKIFRMSFTWNMGWVENVEIADQSNLLLVSM